MWEINGIRTCNEKFVMECFHLNFPPMVKSLLDTDLYKFSMGQTYHHQFGNLETVWDFKARNVGEGKSLPEIYDPEDSNEIKNQLRAYCALRFEEHELRYLATKCPWIRFDYINFLRFWHPRFEDFIFAENPETGLSISFAGVQEYVEYYEIPVLEICAETYYRNHFDYADLLENFKKINEKKIHDLIHCIGDANIDTGTWSEFGARRRLSFEAQDWLIGRFAECKKDESRFVGFVGTSNVYLAMKYDLTPVGTCAHEFIECVGQGNPMYNPAYSNKLAMEAWVKEYGVWNGIWLTDTIGDELCRRDMKKTYATLFSGVRNDSGDPFIWAKNWVEHYKSLGIDPSTKTLLFSNSISNFRVWGDLCKITKELGAKPAFGIGTWWSGPQNISPLNIVAKVVLVNGRDVAKLSDDEGKTMSRSSEYVDYLRRNLVWRIESGE